MLTQTRPGARGALLFHGCVPPSEFETPWPDGVPLQIHMMEEDEWAEEDLVVARELVDEIENAELFLYPGDGRLFADSSLADFDEEAAALLKKRTSPFSNPPGRTLLRLLVDRDVRAAEARERLALPAGPAVLKRQPGDARHQVELGGPGVAELDGIRLDSVRRQRRSAGS